MSQAHYPFRNSRPRRRREQRPEDLSYFQQAFDCLRAHPERVARVQKNLAYYEQQRHLPKAAQAAIKRFQYLLAVTDDPEEMAHWVMADSIEGQKFRQLPLLLKGVCDTDYSTTG